MDDKNVNSVFNEYCEHLKFDAVLAKKFYSFRIEFENKNDDHMSFFGGNLLGVQVVRFTEQEKNTWFTDIMMVNDLELEQAILDLPAINPNFHVSSDLFNLSALWLVHKFLNSPLLNDEQKHQAMINICLMLNYRFLTSRLAHNFKFPAEKEIAEATYTQLSNKFAIKQHGSWRATMIARSEDFISKTGIHYETLKKFNNDFKIVDTLNDAQNRIRSMIKNITEEFYKVRSQGIKVTISKSTSVNIDGVEMLKDRTKSLIGYGRYMHSIVTDRNAFIKPELIEVIAKILHTMPAKLLTQTLEWICANYNYDKNKLSEKLIDLTLTHSFSYLSENKNLLQRNNDLPTLLAKLRGVYMSSRSSDSDLIEMREISEVIVSQSAKTKSSSVVASVKTGVLLYIVLRAYTMNYYSKQ
jgi:hypothetical protein